MGQEKRWLEPRIFFEYRRHAHTHAQKARTGCREELIIRSREREKPPGWYLFTSRFLVILS